MLRPDDPFAPPGPAFSEPWHAQVLALAEAMVGAGHVSAGDWANALGHCLSEAEARHAPDTEDTYYQAALKALERISADAGIDAEAVKHRRDAWHDAYLSTPHGQPVKLG